MTSSSRLLGLAFLLLVSSDTLQAGEKFPLQPTPPGTARRSSPSSAPAVGRKVPLEPPHDSRSFEAFLNRCQRERIPFKLSLKQFGQECARAQQAGRLPNELRCLKGFTWFFGFAIDAKNKDIILLGLKDPGRPPIDIDCLVTALRTAYEGKFPACSLEKHPDPQYQESIIRGIPWGTRWAEIMIEADYDMKKISQGQVSPGISGLNSWFDLWNKATRRLREQGYTGQIQQANRWCFTRPKKDIQRTLTLLDNEVVLLYRNPVMLETEQEIEGKYGAGVIAKEAEEFALGFTRELNLLGKKYKSIGELLALYRLQDLMVHLKLFTRGAPPPQAEYWLTAYKHPYAGPAKAVPTLSRTAQYTLSPDGNPILYTLNVAGGVRMNLNLDPKSFKSEQAPASLKQRILGGRE